MMSLFSVRPRRRERRREPLLSRLVGVEEYAGSGHVDLFRSFLSCNLLFLFFAFLALCQKKYEHLQLTMRSLLPSLRRSPAPGLRLGTNLSDLGAASNARARTETAPPARERQAMLVHDFWRASEEALPIETEFCIALIGFDRSKIGDRERENMSRERRGSEEKN